MKVRLQEIISRSSEDETIEDKIYDTLVAAVRANLVATNVLAIRVGAAGIPGDSITFNLADKDIMLVHEIAEGQEVPIDYGTISHFTVTPKKYGLRPLITKEMMEDGKWDLIQYNLEEAGYQMAKFLDSLLLAQIEAGDTAASNTVSGGTAITVANLNSGRYNLRNGDYNPTDLIVSAAIEQDLLNIDTFVEADKAGVTNPSQGLLGRILGMNVWVSTQVTANYAYIIDRQHALVLAEKRPITIERYDDVTRDLSGAVITARWGVRYLQSAACCVITTS